MIQIVRIEHTNGLGPYINSAYDNMVNNNWYEKHNQHFPAPQTDPIINRRPNVDEHCAFKTIDQLQSLFEPEELKELITLEYNISLINVKDCIMGQTQVLYKKEDIISTEIINSLFI